MPRLSFSLRDLFWLTLLAGVSVGWSKTLKNYEAAETRAEELEKFLESMGEPITWNRDRTKLILPEPTGATF